MKNKAKSGLWIIIIFITFLSLVCSVSAADLKVVQDKYRTSYNNFMKALKDGANQEQIDKLSEQCKEDYAEYQTAVNASNELTTKSKKTSNTTFKNSSVVTETTAKTNNKKPEQIDAKKLKETKTKAINTMKANSFESVPMIEREIKINGKTYKYKTFAPSISKNNRKPISIPKKITEPLRISEPIMEPKRLKLETEPLPQNPEEIAAENMLSEIAKMLDGFTPTESDPQKETYLKIDEALHVICIKYEKYSYICAKAKLYAVDLCMKTLPKDDVMKNYQITNLCGEIKEYYSKNKEQRTVDVLGLLAGRISELNKRIEQSEKYDIEKINQNIKYAQNAMANFNKEIKYASSQVYSDPFFIPSFEYNLDGVLKSYSDTAYACAFNGYYSKAQSIMTELDTFYNSIPSNITVRCYKSYGSEEIITKTIEIKKDATSYFTAKGSYALAMKMRAQKYYYDENVITFDDAQKEFDKFNEEVAKIPRPGEKMGNYTTEFAVIQSMLEQPITKPKFTEVYYARTEETRLKAEDIVDPYDETTLKLIIDKQASTINLMPFKIEVKSNVSNRNKILHLRPNIFYGLGYDYYARLKPNEDETGNDKAKNMIKKHGDKDDMFIHSISCATGFKRFLQDEADWPGNPFKAIQGSKFFKAIIGEAVAKKQAADPDTIAVITKNIIEAMGHELITSDLIVKDVKSVSLIVRNQADWYFIDSHGGKGVLSVQLEDPTPDNLTGIRSRFLISDLNFNLTNIKGVIFGACNVLRVENHEDSEGELVIDYENSSGIQLLNKFSSKILMLGYNGYSSYECLEPINTITTEELAECYSKFPGYPYVKSFNENIAMSWLRNHQMRYKQSAKDFLDKYGSFDKFDKETKDIYDSATAPKYACAIYDNKYYFLTPLNVVKIKAIAEEIPLDTEYEFININKQ